MVEVEVEIEKSDKEYFEIFECLSIIYTLADIHWELQTVVKPTKRGSDMIVSIHTNSTNTCSTSHN